MNSRRSLFLQQFNLPQTPALQDEELACTDPHHHCGIDLICAASVAGDDGEFRRFKEELRKSKMVNPAGNRQLLKIFVERRGEELEAKRRDDCKISQSKRKVIVRQQTI
mmetsp:Transcript_19344/g.29136  ORF Transcript_19344/g.29136 Transcript_19344/m.29136 type:complete len:109 (+) Transcript_19344:141-467(+)|eukprot:CAMPEP_0178925304 /NCGR_PEP_ID=MMETSP0786-20121207/17828_1 /TAXON_ID=186022 /ORGANISM="Thalassionema frauenfeldii, Strain CCMP 1798" /LENGTH=108 /DNA_ID=CAMNT_0020600151 /DNA_START=121 /DNA_END=447 /DNA_ORIENTATION=-